MKQECVKIKESRGGPDEILNLDGRRNKIDEESQRKKRNN